MTELTTKQISEIFIHVKEVEWKEDHFFFSLCSYGGRLYKRIVPSYTSDNLSIWSKNFSSIDESLSTKLETCYQKSLREKKLKRLLQ